MSRRKANKRRSSEALPRKIFYPKSPFAFMLQSYNARGHKLRFSALEKAQFVTVTGIKGFRKFASCFFWSQPMVDYLEIGRQILSSQPFSVFLGAQLDEFGPGMVTLSLSLRPEYLQQYGIAHGGILSYMADNALSFAGGSVLGPAIITSEYKINYLKKAAGERLVAQATVVSSSKRQAVCTCEVYAVTGDEKILCALAQGTIVSIGSEQ
jgi:uncharacterized protein (TIGR00369 family)